MSKAFTSEEAPEPVSLARAAPVLRPGEVRYVTPDGHAALRAEVERLRAELGGASPGSEPAARRGDLTRRLALAAGTLAALTVLGTGDAPPGRAAFGRWVTVEEEGGLRSTWRLVGPDEADPRRGLLSVHAPVGRALLGREVGDVVEVERAGRPRAYTVVAVRDGPP